MTRHRIVTLAVGLTVVFTGGDTAASLDNAESIPLAVVGPDTITSLDVHLELGVLVRSNASARELAAPDSAPLLKRLIQNQLLVQEGYRLNLHESFAVANRVKEAVRANCVAALLDSVAWSLPDDLKESLAARKSEVNLYLAKLMDTYGVVVDSTLLASLDFGSTDPEVAEAIRNSNEVLAEIPSGRLVVSSFYRVVMFDEFHGLAGKPDAAERRDAIFENWLFEALLTYEVRRIGMEQRPQYKRMAATLERTLVGEEAFDLLVDLDYEPSPEEVAAFYEDNLDLVTPPAMVKLKSVMLTNKEAAELFRSRLQKGAKLNWLIKNTKDVVEGDSPFAEEWQAPNKVGLKPEDAVLGFVPEPLEFPGGGWVVAVVSAVAPQDPLPLEACRRQLEAYMKKTHMESQVGDIMARLEAATEVKILPGAEQTIQDIIEVTIADANALRRQAAETSNQTGEHSAPQE